MTLPTEQAPHADLVAIVTGGNSGIGLATANRLLEGGAYVLVVDLAAEPVIEVNFKMCSDCHSAFKAASKLWAGRRVRCHDGSRYHVFFEGECSCKDTWR